LTRLVKKIDEKHGFAHLGVSDLDSLRIARPRIGPEAFDVTLRERSIRQAIQCEKWLWGKSNDLVIHESIS